MSDIRSQSVINQPVGHEMNYGIVPLTPVG